MLPWLLFLPEPSVDVSDFSPSLAKEISAMSAAATSNAKYVGQYALH